MILFELEIDWVLILLLAKAAATQSRAQGVILNKFVFLMHVVSGQFTWKKKHEIT